MQSANRDDILRQLAVKQDSGQHVDSRLLISVRNSQALYFFPLLDKESFLSLIWQECDATRLLTPRGQPRTLNEIGARSQTWPRFQDLASPLNLPEGEHHPAWFEKCVQIDAAFDYALFGWIAIVHPTDGECRQSPGGSFYIYDGVHRTLVLAKRLLSNQTHFQPVNALMIVPRRP